MGVVISLLLLRIGLPLRDGRAHGFERAMDNLGAVIGPIVALALVALREAILLSAIPGLLAAAAIVYAVRHLSRGGGRWHRSPGSLPP
jgi:hypothetical protein